MRLDFTPVSGDVPLIFNATLYVKTRLNNDASRRETGQEAPRVEGVLRAHSMDDSEEHNGLVCVTEIKVGHNCQRWLTFILVNSYITYWC